MSCADQESFGRGDPTLTGFFPVFRQILIPPEIASHYRPASETPFNGDDPTLVAL